ncbi:hypothetical protein ACFLYU_05690 [Candidatus Dependentiae bacterium]
MKKRIIFFGICLFLILSGLIFYKYWSGNKLEPTIFGDSNTDTDTSVFIELANSKETIELHEAEPVKQADKALQEFAPVYTSGLNKSKHKEKDDIGVLSEESTIKRSVIEESLDKDVEKDLDLVSEIQTQYDIKEEIKKQDVQEQPLQVDMQEARRDAKKEVAKEIAKEITQGIFKLIDKAEVKNKISAQKEHKKLSRKLKKKREKEKYKNYLRPSILFLGELYNHALVEDYKDRRWVINASFHNLLDFKAFNNCSSKVCLSDLLFGKFKIKDIFLLSKLSYEDKIYLIDVELPLQQERLARNRKVDQYLAYIAPFNVCINAENKEKWVDFGGFYRFSIGQQEDVVCSLGFNIPVKSCTHIMSLDLVGVDAKQCGFSEDDINFVLNDFHQNFIDVSDFFKRVILEPKGLCFKERQNKVGVGDITLFAFFDLNRLTESVEGLQLGIDLTVPSGNKYKGKNVWEVILGNGGAVQLGFSVNSLFKTSKKYLNPTVGLAGKVSFEFSSCRRVPRLVQSKQPPSECGVGCCDCYNNKIEDTPCLIAPVFKTHYVKAFAEYDSCVHEFADCAVNTKTKTGGIALFTLGNYFYNVFREAFRLGVFYDFMYKARDNVYVCDKKAIYNTCALEECTKINWHQFSWHLAYVSDAGVEVNVGSKHVLYAKNYPQTNAIFASLIANF